MSPSPSTVATIDDAQKSATDAADYISRNWADWLSAGLRILLILVIALVLRSVVRRMITKFIERMNRGAEVAATSALGGLLVNAERRRQRSEAIGSVLRSVASFVIMGTAALTVLSVLQINLAPLLASAGVAGVAIGFGARNLVTDFLSGVFMILEDQYGVGDVIDAGVASGTVVEVGLRVTKLRGDNGEIWYIRNGEVKRIGNLSQGWATAVVDVQVGYGEDLDRARTVIEETAAAMAKDQPWDEVLWEPVEVLGLESVTSDSVLIQTQAKTMPGKAAAVARELRWRIKRAFDASGIAIVGGTPQAVEEGPADPSAAVAPPSALADPASPQALAAQPPAPAPASSQPGAVK
ncbi:mechanosensitive ion channel family protein [Actinacidiphila sp. bgisy160]|uniref:mechanosensitive ion channel family protein n=1 Tax=Actinacidiphila sp. bgisy160 TaxID=3413796 RepID=UPI003D716830